MDASARNDLLNAFAKFSPASVHAELTDVSGSRSNFQAMSRKFMVQKAFTEPSAKMCQGALLFVDISGFTRLSTSLGIEALKRHINAIYTRAVDIIVKHGGDVLKFAGDAMLISRLAGPPTHNCDLSRVVPRTAFVLGDLGREMRTRTPRSPVYTRGPRGRTRGTSLESARERESSPGESRDRGDGPAVELAPFCCPGGSRHWRPTAV